MQAILFGPKMSSLWMERMVTVARDAQGETPALPSSFHEALDSVGRLSWFETAMCSTHVLQVQLSETFLGIADSLRKPRGALIRPSFLAPLSTSRAQPEQGCISRDGHQFSSKKPASVQQPFHMWVLLMKLPKSKLTTNHHSIFLIDR